MLYYHILFRSNLKHISHLSGDVKWSRLHSLFFQSLTIFTGVVFLCRLFDSAKAMAFTSVPSRTEVKNAVFSTLIANGMRDSAHIRLTLTRGKKVKHFTHTSQVSKPGFVVDLEMRRR
jgi:hypothetical protein